MTPEPPSPPRDARRPGPGGLPNLPGRPGFPRPVIWGLIALAVLALVLAPSLTRSKSDAVDYSTFRDNVTKGQVAKIDVNNDTSHITGKTVTGKSFSTTAPAKIPDADLDLFREKNVKVDFHPPSSNLLGTILVYGLPIALIIGFWLWMSRRAQGQMAGIMSIGRSKAKVYNTEKPKTTFADVAGYPGVKQEIAEVVEFLKETQKFRDIGARIPKGVLLVGPPGTGKTLIARAVAGEAGVPFMSITGSDFMEMFVGVGAARVRDLFQTARKQAPCIIFVDELDSIGRKRGAGLGGGHDEREQTLNQMLSEMDGFEATEGVVMMAATNRPDILDPALLRPGRFDRQIVVPLPDLDERLPILQVHSKDKKLDDDVDLSVVARGTPGMSGADLANLVNEAALFAVRRGSAKIYMEDFEGARDRVLMGQRRESMAISDEEKEIIAYHEGGHAVLAYAMEHADPLHKVTILPSGMALGNTQQLPLEERHIYQRPYIQDSLVVRLGGRIAEELIFGNISTGANNDLVGCTELARKMVREWGMSDRVGPMAWGSQGMVFLGEDLMHNRDYSDETARVIDEEVERILREQEDRAREVLRRHRSGLDAVASALLENETIDGAEVGRLVDQAAGHQVRRPHRLPEFSGPAAAIREAVPTNGDAKATSDQTAKANADQVRSRRPR
ncbi:MAG TPA: ATP-dependent zinc metalloprotease FtsH [Acidimicrobiales bacterium]|nr:ATP-dependent zinc metalloprotease FtsH [Acidimicrobiales bacterium]